MVRNREFRKNETEPARCIFDQHAEIRKRTDDSNIKKETEGLDSRAHIEGANLVFALL